MFKRNNGIFFGLLGALFWGIDTVLLVFVSKGNAGTSDIRTPLIIAFLHDFFSCIWVLVIRIVNDKKINVWHYGMKAIGLQSFASVLGAPLGMTSYVIAIFFLTSSLTSIMSSIYPVVSALLAIIILKEKVSFKGISGVILCVISIALLGISGSITNFENFGLGLFFCFLCVFGWGSESVLSSLGMSEEILPIDALQIRQFISVIVYLLIIFPVMKINILDSLVNINITLVIFIALLGTLSYIFYYTSIATIGATIATSLNVSYSVWASILFSIGHRTFSLVLVCSSILIVIGNYLVIKGTTKEEN
ncbi:DMT family transporter [Latilactobacillus curvatus]|uniref:DMT family transporter n=1 Tax=Latilactobacillus curvatus TaxID=28038 RepID=UPI000975C598|nr:DMT family transporter [Latilactobacillus curvatus]MCT3524987.1 DMT family transporter [Latilactobacillus curvatus]UTB70905.1 hypothetical protein A4W71_07395 [Latilactobacillus curvatus]UTB73819.1 hypothetical protein A4W73_02715 [Latilactobacillus curvatus]UTY79721.1 hypothetical protein A4W76_02735 [Latilactobacillus curvatus]